jgi:hypothetical protein
MESPVARARKALANWLSGNCNQPAEAVGIEPWPTRFAADRRDNSLNQQPRGTMGPETIVLKIRWIGVVLGLLWVNLAPTLAYRAMLNGILLLGLAYALWDTWATLRGWMLAQRYPLVISLLEALFIGVLCYYDAGVHSPFRYYYLLSLIICALRYEPVVTYVTFGLHSASFGVLYLHAPGAKKMLESCCWVWC